MSSEAGAHAVNFDGMTAAEHETPAPDHPQADRRQALLEGIH
jgi:hypothetical protein